MDGMGDSGCSGASGLDLRSFFIPLQVVYLQVFVGYPTTFNLRIIFGNFLFLGGYQHLRSFLPIIFFESPHHLSRPEDVTSTIPEAISAIFGFRKTTKKNGRFFFVNSGKGPNHPQKKQKSHVS